jgi:protoheme IX farnesyltransferase
MLPSKGGRDMGTRFQILIYTLFLVPISLTPYWFGFTGIYSSIVVLLMGILFLFQAYRLYKDGEMTSARKLMFGSFLLLTRSTISFNDWLLKLQKWDLQQIN